MATAHAADEDQRLPGHSRGRPGPPRQRFEPSYLRAWRKHRGMTLRRLADTINQGAQQPITSYASLARIEQGLQPYSQPILEGAARVLGTTPAALLSAGPDEADSLAAIWAALDAPRRARALAILRAIAGAP